MNYIKKLFGIGMMDEEIIQLQTTSEPEINANDQQNEKIPVETFSEPVIENETQLLSNDEPFVTLSPIVKVREFPQDDDEEPAVMIPHGSSRRVRNERKAAEEKRTRSRSKKTRNRSESKGKSRSRSNSHAITGRNRSRSRSQRRKK